jgi:hypothetical protein
MLQIFPKDACWDYAPLSRFVSALRTVDPNVTGEPVASLHGVDEMINGLKSTGLVASALIFGICWFNLRRFHRALLAMAPLGFGCVLMAGFMVLTQTPINPANVIALPLILGLAVDFGLHVIHDAQHHSGPYRLSWRLGRALVLSSATTVVGFAALLVSGHRGMASIGLVMTLGVTCCAAMAMFSLPALLQLMSESPPEKTGTQTRPPILRMPSSEPTLERQAA